MKKIALVANTDWYLYNFRLSLANYLREQGYEVTLISPPGDYVRELQRQGFPWISWPVSRQGISPPAELPALFGLMKIYRQLKPDLVHHHTIKPVLYGSLAAQWCGVGGVVNSITGRGYVFGSRQLRARIAYQAVKHLYRLAFKPPNAVAVFENRFDQQVFIDQGFVPESQTRFIAGVGVDQQRFRPSPLPAGIPIVTMVGRLLWDKGVHVFVDAARLLRADGIARFILVGAPDPGNPGSIDPSQINAWVSEGIIEWWGWQDDTHTVYSQSHMVVLPTSYGEGIPVVLLEAAASGRAVVASDTPGCREAVRPGYNGLLVPTDDAPAVAGALRTLIADIDLCARMGANGRQLVLEQFTVGQVNAATLEVYRQLISGD